MPGEYEPSRVERVLNLLALLLDTSRHLGREEIIDQISGYPSEAVAYKRAFERDKEMLRAMGVPIDMVTLPDGVDAGYRVKPEEYYLADLGLSDEETAALHVAVSAVALGNRAGEGALMKIGGLAGSAAPPIAMLPLVPALPTLFEAFRRRAQVTFVYREERRTVQPWGLTGARGHWYLVGYDVDRGAPRTFRADRITGDVSMGAPGAFEPPEDVRLEERVTAEPWTFGDAEPIAVRVRVDADHVDGVVSRAGDEADVEFDGDGSAVVTMLVSDVASFRTFVLGFLDHAEVIDPPAVRAEIVAWLEAIAGAEHGTEDGTEHGNEHADERAS